MIDEQCPNPAEKHPDPGVHLSAQQEIGYELPAARGQNRGESHRELLTILSTEGAAHQAQCNQQTREKSQEHIEGHGLRNHAALRNDSCYCSEQFLRKRA